MERSRSRSPKHTVVNRSFLGWTTPLSMMPFFSNNNNNNPQKQGVATEATVPADHKERVRIAIIGGGIAGITAARAIAARLSSTNVNPEIVVWEADGAAEDKFSSTGQPPRWRAATARNANSIVPGAAMHIMSQRSTLWQIAVDTVSEFGALKYEQAMEWLGHGGDTLLNIDNFQVPPPYFAFHVLQCLGPHVSWAERR